MIEVEIYSAEHKMLIFAYNGIRYCWMEISGMDFLHKSMDNDHECLFAPSCGARTRLAGSLMVMVKEFINTQK